MFNRIRSDRQARIRTALSRLGFDTLEARKLLTTIVYNPPSTGQAFVQPYTFRVTNPFAGTQTIDLAIHQLGSGNGTLNKSTVILAPNAGTNVIFTPTADSSAVNDLYITESISGNIIDEELFTIASVTFPQNIKHADTPVGMKDRIPNRVNTEVPITITPSLVGGGDPILISVLGQGSGHGTVKINNSSFPVQINSSTTIDLKGVNQTQIGYTFDEITGVMTKTGDYAGKLKLTASAAGKNTVTSDGFSVAAIPIAVTDNYERPASEVRAGTVGNLDFVTFTSDSNDPTDLDAVYVSERVVLNPGNGVFLASFPVPNPDYLKLSTAGQVADINGVPADRLKSPGGYVSADQMYLFANRRTGDTHIAVNNSGFTITFYVYQDLASIWTLRVTKKGDPKIFTIGSTTYSTAAGFVADPSGLISEEYTN